MVAAMRLYAADWWSHGGRRTSSRRAGGNSPSSHHMIFGPEVINDGVPGHPKLLGDIAEICSVIGTFSDLAHERFKDLTITGHAVWRQPFGITNRTSGQLSLVPRILPGIDGVAGSGCDGISPHSACSRRTALCRTSKRPAASALIRCGYDKHIRAGC